RPLNTASMVPPAAHRSRIEQMTHGHAVAVARANPAADAAAGVRLEDERHGGGPGRTAPRKHELDTLGTELGARGRRRYVIDVEPRRVLARHPQPQLAVRRLRGLEPDADRERRVGAREARVLDGKSSVRRRYLG